MSETVYIQKYGSPLGTVTLACRDDMIIGLWFDGQKHYGSTLGHDAVEACRPVLSLAAGWLDIYFSGREPSFVPPLCLCGTPFSRAVWRAITDIPYGSTLSYKELASRLALAGLCGAGAVRAVASAVGRNPVSLMVPCHRVLGSDGCLRGYAGGLWRKAWLLELERGMGHRQ